MFCRKLLEVEHEQVKALRSRADKYHAEREQYEASARQVSVSRKTNSGQALRVEGHRTPASNLQPRHRIISASTAGWPRSTEQDDGLSP